MATPHAFASLLQALELVLVHDPVHLRARAVVHRRGGEVQLRVRLFAVQLLDVVAHLADQVVLLDQVLQRRESGVHGD